LRAFFAVRKQHKKQVTPVEYHGLQADISPLYLKLYCNFFPTFQQTPHNRNLKKMIK
jgi:hypothetical protein